MKPLEISAKEASPYIKFDPAGYLEIKGKSFDEDVVSLYGMIFQKLDEFAASDKEKLEVNIYLKYFNTASSKCLYDLVRTFKKLHEQDGVEVKLTWNYIEEDEDMQEEIEEFRDAIDFDFQIEAEQDFL